jgi:hypothetical protein
MISIIIIIDTGLACVDSLLGHLALPLADQHEFLILFIEYSDSFH